MFSKLFQRLKGGTSSSRTATQQDVASGKAIFYVPRGMSQVYDLGVSLPAEGHVKRAIQSKGGNDVPVGTSLIIVQAETGPKGIVMVGALINGQNFVCTMDDVALGKADGETNIN
jgi:hypothetical protein